MTAWGALGPALIVTVVVVWAVRRAKPGAKPALLAAAASLALAASFVPLGELSLASHVRALVGELSVTSMLLLSARLVALAGGPKLPERERSVLLACVVASGLFLYPMALGVTRFDPYALGFGSLGLIGVMGLLALGSAFSGLALLPLALAGSAGAFALELSESSNFWDYWLDPWLFAYASIRAIHRITIFVAPSKSR